MSRLVPIVLVLASLSGASKAQAQGVEQGLRACRQITDAERRLSCYDAVQLSPATTTAVPSTSGSTVALPQAASDPTASFGQERIQRKADAAEVKQIESRVRGKFSGWNQNSRLELDNGQVWRIAEDSSADYELQAPKVIVRRGLLGAYYIEVEGVPFQARVVRVR